MGKLRFLLALWMAKLSIPALKITRHNGTDFPGALAIRICPDFLRYAIFAELRKICSANFSIFHSSYE